MSAIPVPPAAPGATGQWQRQPAFQQQQQQGAGRQAPMPMRNVQVFNSTRVSDITPPVTLTEAFCLRQLTTYEVYTLRKAEPLDDQNLEKNFQQGYQTTRRGSKDSKRSNKTKANWQRVTISQDVYDQQDIIKKIRSLDMAGAKAKRSVTDKKNKLAANQHTQVTRLLDEKIAYEYDPNFTWTLSQIEQKIDRSKDKPQTESITVYLKRSIRPGQNPIEMYQTIENYKLQQQRHQQQMAEQKMNEQLQARMQANQARNAAAGNGAQNGGYRQAADVQVVQEPRARMDARPARRVSNDDVVEVIEEPQRNKSPRASSVKYSKKGRKDARYSSESSGSSSESSSSDSETDSDAAYTSSETTRSSASSGPRARRGSVYNRKDMPHRRSHEKDYVMVEAPRRRASAAAYVPDPPRRRAYSHERPSVTGGIGVDQIVADAFAAGVVSATKAAVADQMATAPPFKTISYADDRSRSSIEDELRLRDERRSRELRETLRLQDDLRRDDFQAREELRLRDDLRRAEERIRRDSIPSPRTRDSDFFHESISSPRIRERELFHEPISSIRIREPAFLRRGSLSPLPLDNDRAFDYVRNPQPNPFRRRDTLYHRF